MYIDTQDGLRALVEQLRGTTLIAIDTEFVRERQYLPQLEIVQIATDSTTAILDYRALGTLEPFTEILHDVGVIKVFHAASQDLEILFNVTGKVPTPLFDTQVASAMVGLGPQVGYSRLVENLVGIALAKTETLTDWGRRPLTEAQKEYALDDVRYLLPVYRLLDEKLRALGRQEWLYEEWAAMSDPDVYRRVHPREAYRRIGGINKLRPHQLAILRELADWREREAIRRDRPAGVVLKDAILLEIARRGPHNERELGEVRAITSRDIDRLGSALLATVEKGRKVPRDQYPRVPERTTLTGQESSLVTLLQAWLRARSEELDIAVNYLATTAEVQDFVAADPEERADAMLLRGWRRRLVGLDLLAIIEGRAALAWSAKAQQLTLRIAESQDDTIE